ncbi:hypothetical protein V2J09_008179 [Rumex salicifolius]
MACCSAAKRRGVIGAEKCDDCRSWEEQLYWKRFQPLHFCQILRPGSEFQKQIGIPRKFAQNAKPLLPPKVTLRGPSGASWDAMLTKRGDDLFICDGWEGFMKAYTIEANSVLFFKYDGVSAFDILIFDGENFCEKESAYFIKKCGLAEPSTEPQTGQRKRIASEADIEDNNDNHIKKTTKQAKKEVATKTVEETPKNLSNTNSNSNSKGRKKKPASRKKVPPESNTRERTPIHNPENLCDSFAMLAELGKSIVQNATSYLEPENTTEPNGTESHNQKNTPIVNGSIFPEVPSQDTPQNNGTFATPASARSRATGKRKSLNETSLQKASAKGNQKKASSSHGKKQSSKKKNVITDAVPLSMQPYANGKLLVNYWTRIRAIPIIFSDEVNCFLSFANVFVVDTDVMPFGSSADRPKRYVSDEGKVAVELARKQMTDKSFLLVLRPTNVYKRHMVTVPPAWFKKHLPPKSQNVCLRFEDKTWKTKLGYSAVKTTGQICGGWKQFVQDNRLEEFDVCVFSFVSQSDNEAVVDVGIFRAVPIPPMVTPLRQGFECQHTPNS